MGDCFSISLNITLKNEAAAVRVMQEYIQNKPYVNFGLEENQKRGIGTDNFNDLIRIFFSSCNGTVIDVARNEDIISYNADFDATYSWKSVMLDIFGSIAPFLEDGSELNISSIDDYFCAFSTNYRQNTFSKYALCINFITFSIGQKQKNMPGLQTQPKFQHISIIYYYINVFP